MKKTEYKTIRIKQGVIMVRSIEKFTANVTEELNEISAELADGWELATIFALELGCFAVFKREV